MSDANLTNDQNSLDDSSLRFANLELGDAAPVVDDKAERVGQNDDKGQSGHVGVDLLTGQAPEPPPIKAIPGVTVDQDGVRRGRADEAAAVAAGHSIKPPIYQLGTLVNHTGQENFKKFRHAFEEMPLLGDACQDLINQVAREERTDVLVDLTNLTMTADGLLHVPGDGAYKVSERGIEGLAFFSVPGGGGGSYLKTCPAPLRADNLNHWFKHAYRMDKRATLDALEAKGIDPADGVDLETEYPNDVVYVAKKATVRTRKDADGSRCNFATVGPRYGNFDIDRVVSKVYEALAGKGDARADVTYDGYKLRLDVLFHSNIQPEKAVAGEIFQAGLVIRAADDGSGSINVSTELMRNLCLNLIILDHSKILIGKRRHSGKSQDIGDKITEHLQTAEEKLKYFMTAWSAANTENILERYDLGTPRDVFRGLVLNKIVHVPGVKPDDMINKLMDAWSKEEGYSKASFINAITRMSHESEWKSWETTTDLESLAGEMLFERNWNYAVPPKTETLESVLGGF